MKHLPETREVQLPATEPLRILQVPDMKRVLALIPDGSSVSDTMPVL